MKNRVFDKVLIIDFTLPQCYNDGIRQVCRKIERKQFMSYLALYRKFRPDNFKDVKGQDTYSNNTKKSNKSLIG